MRTAPKRKCFAGGTGCWLCAIKIQIASPKSKSTPVVDHRCSNDCILSSCFQKCFNKANDHRRVQFDSVVLVKFPDHGSLPDVCPAGSAIPVNWFNGATGSERLREGKLPHYEVGPPDSCAISLPPLRIDSELAKCLFRDETNALAQSIALLQAMVLNRQVVVEWIEYYFGDVVTGYDDVMDNRTFVKALPRYFAANPLPV